MNSVGAPKVSKPGGKKKPVSKLKNVLAYPFPQYWPEISEDQIVELKDRITKVKNDENSKATTNNVAPIIGLSKILREINRNEKMSFILSTDIKPKFIATQIINLTLSRFQSCKVLCVPKLKDLTKSLFGIESIAFGYKKGQCPSIEKWIKNIQEKCFPVPEKILSYYAKGKSDLSKSSNIISVPKVKNRNRTLNVIDINSLYLKRCNDKRTFIPPNAENSRRNESDVLENESTEWSDFISLSMQPKSKFKSMDVDDDSDEIEMEKQKLANKITQLFAEKANINTEENGATDNDSKKLKKKKSKQSSEEIKQNEMLKHPKKFNYIGLTINRIQPNPDRIKKKTKKNKKTSKNYSSCFNSILVLDFPLVGHT